MSFGNQFKTVALLGVLTALLLWVGQLVGGPGGLTIAIIFALLMNFGSYWFSDKIVLAMYRAKEVDSSSAPRLHRIVKELSQRAGLPMPKVYIMESATPNAFATGRDPKHSAVAATTGILNLLDDNELKGVMAHELSHIKNYDIRIMTIVIVLVGIVALLSDWFLRTSFFGKNRT
jgi:heat shock protein HtpX